MELYLIFLLEMREILKIVLYGWLNDFLYEYILSDVGRLESMILYCKRVICFVIYFGYYLIL